MPKCFLTQAPDGELISIIPIIKSHFVTWFKSQNPEQQRWMKANRFLADPGTYCFMPKSNGNLAQVIAGLSSAEDFWSLGDLPLRLPEGNYQIQESESIWRQAEQWREAVIAWGLGCYSFSRYQRKNRKPDLSKARLLIPSLADTALCQNLVDSIYLVRDLINTPAEDLSPEILAKAAVEIAQQHKAEVQVISGEDLKESFPAIYAVGKGSTRPSQLVDLRWGDKGAPLLTLVGKGICFDSGGLNLKSGEGMRYMKKDMAGAAHVLGLARLIILQNLPVRLRVLLAIADNMPSGNSYRPGDVIITRGGVSVEITNTDAEGRMVLGDALAAAVDDRPDLLLDFSTLTGAARIALGPDIAALFSNHDDLAGDLIRAGQYCRDPIWRLPFYQGYERYLKSEVADISNASAGPFAGAITAALYLKQFVPAAIPWAHFDISAWNFDKLPGRPVGGEANALRAVFAYLEKRYQQT